MRDTGKKIAYGAAWMILFKFAQRSLSIVSTLVLVRLLLPSDFGVIAMSVSIIAFLDHLGAFKFDIVLIQKQDATASHYNTAWTFNVIFGLASCTILMILSGPAAEFFREPDLKFVILSLASVPLLQGFENIGVVAFRKEMNFNKEFRYRLAKKLIGFSITIPLAFLLRSYWALVVGMLGAQLGALALSYAMHHYRPRFSVAAWRELFHFSKWLVLNSLLGFLRLRSADFIIGRIAGTRSLGFYNIAFNISTLVTTQISAPINRAVFPGFVKMTSETSMLRNGYLSVLSALCLAMMPAAAGIAVVADPFVKVVLGEAWIETIPLIQILAFLGLISAIASNSLSVYLAVGRPWIITALHGLALVLVLPLALYLSSTNGVKGAATAYLVIAVLVLPVDFRILFRILDLKIREFAAVMWRPIIATAIMHLSVTSYLSQTYAVGSTVSDVFRLTSSVALGGLIYVTAIVTLWYLSSKPDGVEKIVIGKVLSKIKR